MIEDAEEWENVRKAVVDSSHKLADAIETHGKGEWDFLVVAVPSGRPTTRIGLMSSLPPENIPVFLAWLGSQMTRAAERGTVLDDRPCTEKPS